MMPTYGPDEERPGRSPQNRTSPPYTVSSREKHTRWPALRGGASGGDAGCRTWV